MLAGLKKLGFLFNKQNVRRNIWPTSSFNTLINCALLPDPLCKSSVRAGCLGLGYKLGQ